MSESDRILNIILLCILGFIPLYAIGAVIYGQILLRRGKSNRQLSAAKPEPF